MFVDFLPYRISIYEVSHYRCCRSSDSGEAVVTSELPHTITQWIGRATCINEELGLGVSDVATITTFQSFFLSATLPYSAVRTEEIPVAVTVFNYLQDCLPVSSINSSPVTTMLDVIFYFIPLVCCRFLCWSSLRLSTELSVTRLILSVSVVDDP